MRDYALAKNREETSTHDDDCAQYNVPGQRFVENECGDECTEDQLEIGEGLYFGGFEYFIGFDETKVT